MSCICERKKASLSLCERKNAFVDILAASSGVLCRVVTSLVIHVCRGSHLRTVSLCQYASLYGPHVSLLSYPAFLGFAVCAESSPVPIRCLVRAFFNFAPLHAYLRIEVVSYLTLLPLLCASLDSCAHAASWHSRLQLQLAKCWRWSLSLGCC